MRTLLAHIRLSLLLIPLLIVCFSGEAKKPVRKSKPVKANAAFNTDWSNSDSMQFHYQQRKLNGDFTTALRIGDSLIHHPAMQSKVNVLTLQKIDLLDSLGRKSEVLNSLKSWRTALTSQDSLAYYAMQLSTRFASCSDFQSAHEIDQLMVQDQSQRLEKLHFSLDSLQKNAIEENSKHERSLDLAQGQVTSSRIFLWLLGMLAFILAIVCIILILKQFKMRNQHEKLGAQMDHTRTQIDKAFEEGDRINAEIRSMKEQMARIEAEKKQLRQNIADSTTETLPLLRQQLDALAKENTGALPVEKYMAIQNTITRLNKQLRDMS